MYLFTFMYIYMYSHLLQIIGLENLDTDSHKQENVCTRIASDKLPQNFDAVARADAFNSTYTNIYIDIYIYIYIFMNVKSKNIELQYTHFSFMFLDKGTVSWWILKMHFTCGTKSQYSTCILARSDGDNTLYWYAGVAITLPTNWAFDRLECDTFMSFDMT